MSEEDYRPPSRMNAIELRACADFVSHLLEHAEGRALNAFWQADDDIAGEWRDGIIPWLQNQREHARRLAASREVAA